MQNYGVVPLFSSSVLGHGQLPSRPPEVGNAVITLPTGVRLPEDEHYRAQEKNGHDLAERHGVLVTVHLRRRDVTVSYDTLQTEREPKNVENQIKHVRADETH